MAGKGGLRSTSFRKGVSGNPGGKPKNPAKIADRKTIADVRELAKELTPKAMMALEAVLDSETAPPAAKVSAANAILDRGWGKPKETVETTARTTLEDLVMESYRARQKAETVDEAEPDKLH